MDLGLDGKVAVVTGSTSGAGIAIARTLAREGARVVVHGRNEKAGRQVVDAITDAVGTAKLLLADLMDDAAMPAFGKDAIGAFGQVDILVCNAGRIGYYEGWDDVDGADWREMYDGVALTVVRPINALRQHMVGLGWGRIVTIASAQGMQPFGMMPDYAVAKSAVIALTKSLSKQLDRTGVLANCISPGIIATDFVRQRLTEASEKEGRSTEWSDVEEWVLRNEFDNPTGRLATPQDVADAVAFLASERAAYINGTNLMVDGGSVQTIW
jgi:NAD(P)-dependent dehydrogenase (short-subunit alcohol dehydrogenase family)